MPCLRYIVGRHERPHHQQDEARGKTKKYRGKKDDDNDASNISINSFSLMALKCPEVDSTCVILETVTFTKSH